MSCLTNSIAQSDPTLQELIERVKSAYSLALPVLSALHPIGASRGGQSGRGVLNERGQAPGAGVPCPRYSAKLESKGLKPREVLTIREDLFAVSESYWLGLFRPPFADGINGVTAEKRCVNSE